jgi:hypothetical protein
LAADGLAGEPAGPIWPRSGEARPDPARPGQIRPPFLFFPKPFSVKYSLLQTKMLRKSFRPKKFVIQIFL